MSFYKRSAWKHKRAKILKRDKYKCRECVRYGRTTAATTVHHCNPIESHPELALVSDNLLSLCGTCHDKMHDRKSGILTKLGEFWRNKVELLISSMNEKESKE